MMAPLFGGKGDDADRAQRSRDERERARLEREARRAAREGRPAPAMPPAEPPPAPEPPRAASPPPPAPEPPRAASPPPPAPEPPRAASPPPPAPEPPRAASPPPPAPEPPRAASPPTPPPAPPAGGSTFEWDADDEDTGTWSEAPARPAPRESRTERRLRQRTGQLPPVPAGPAPLGDLDDAPVGVKRVSEQQVAAHRAGDPTATGRHRRTLPPPSPGSRRRGVLRLFGVILLVGLAAAGYFANALFEPFADDASGTGQVRVDIPAGASAGDIGDLLAAEDVVDSGFFFGIRARLSGDFEDLRAGPHTLKRGMTYAAAITALTTAPEAAPTINVTVPEGRSRRETLPIIEDTGLRGDYLEATRKPRGFDAAELYGAPEDLGNVEGFLFPATYELRRGATVRDLIDKQLETFREQFATLDLDRGPAKDLTPYEVLIVASMIEREAAIDDERPLIAAVIYNRLEQGIPLGIDATIRFRLNQWTQPLKVSELAVDSDYNTRLRQGLPPGPIGNPGLKSLQAAAKPANSKALFYVVKPCGEGAHAFSETDAEFQEDVAAYNRARDARGGRDPSNC